VLTVLNVAYPLAAVGPDAIGGAEQVLTLLDAALVEAGHRSVVLACEGSHTAGELLEVPRARGPFDAPAIEMARAHHRHAIAQALCQRPIDLVHMHGIDFETYLPENGVPVLATLHCPRDWYPEMLLCSERPNTYLNTVSRHQHAALAPDRRVLGPIENGIRVAAFAGRHAKRRFALMISRIAPEKGVHVALAAAHLAKVPLILAGQTFPYREHERYYRSEVAPQLDRERLFIGPIGLRRKRRLLGAASCLVVSSQVNETSSLVAREAMAAGTPVVALRRGAIEGVVEHGRTGFLVDTKEELAEAMLKVGQIDSEICRRVARQRFSSCTMTRQYLNLYQELTQRCARIDALKASAA
jgi:glycosyltransferase involved in cell wall biosynthesis